MRIRELVLPPAWTDVWICPYPLGHLQAVGTDAAGRKQYRYHDLWRERQDQRKFELMLEFAETLPSVRRKVTRRLAGDELSRTRVLAAAVRMLDIGFFRVGSEVYAEEHDSFGLATLRKDHVRIEDGVLVFDYVGKGGVPHVQAIDDPAVREIVLALKRRRGGGDELLAYKDGRRWRDVTAADVNDMIKELTGGDFSAKAFRTWSGTVLAAVELAKRAETAGTKTARKRAISAAMKEVAGYLGNTPTVARDSYVDPRVIDRFRSGWTIASTLAELAATEDPGRASANARIERAVLDLISDPKESADVERLAA